MNCPFCESAIFFLRQDPASNKYYAECQDCFARGPLANSGLAAIDLWKARHTSRIATFPSFEAARQSPAFDLRATPLYGFYPGKDTLSWALGIIVSDNEVHYLRLNGSYK